MCLVECRHESSTVASNSTQLGAAYAGARRAPALAGRLLDHAAAELGAKASAGHNCTQLRSRAESEADRRTEREGAKSDKLTMDAGTHTSQRGLGGPASAPSQ